MALEENFSTEYDGDINTVVLTIERGDDPYHTFDEQFVSELGELLEEYDGNPEVRGLIVTGAGSRVFSTGADVEGSFTDDMTPADMRNFSDQGKAVFKLLSTSGYATVAAINGLCFGGGLELAMACDFRVASKRARLGLPEIKLGILPGWGGTQLLPRLVGRERALRMILSGDPVRASAAEEIGLVSEVCEHGETVEIAKGLLKRITDKPGPVIARAKRAVQQGLRTDLGSGLDLETELFGLAWSTEERKEGVDEFLNRNSGNNKDDKKQKQSGSADSDE